MVRKTYRTAFTMIELIFAIVIIAISVVSLPMMMQVNSKGMENNLAQEAIFAASVELMQASSGYWDAYSMKDINLSSYSRVVNVVGNDCNATTKLRPGHINQPYHRRCIDDTNLTTPSNASGDSQFDTLNDFNHSAQALFIGNTNAAAGYKNMNYTSKIEVSAHPTDNNIKILTVTVQDENHEIVTVLKTEASNVGETQYYKRTF